MSSIDAANFYVTYEWAHGRETNPVQREIQKSCTLYSMGGKQCLSKIAMVDKTG